jgi:2,4-dienoyl-CoA reductase-like NADH-dependent reductase (Old Yellow Enzyme family)
VLHRPLAFKNGVQARNRVWLAPMTNMQSHPDGTCASSPAATCWTRADAEALLELGADAVAIGRAAIANPDWAARSVDPAWEPRRPPMTIAELLERGLNPTFAGCMRGWKGFVAD